MMLWQEYMTPCVRLNKVSAADGIGGYSYSWQEGETFSAAVTDKATAAARTAEKPDVTETYLVTVARGVSLAFHDVFRRVSDGAVFRVTSNVTDAHTPDRATFQIAQVTAERWVIPE